MEIFLSSIFLLNIYTFLDWLVEFRIKPIQRNSIQSKYKRNIKEQI